MRWACSSASFCLFSRSRSRGARLRYSLSLDSFCNSSSLDACFLWNSYNIDSMIISSESSTKLRGLWSKYVQNMQQNSYNSSAHSKPDIHCNSLYYTLPNSQLNSLQQIQNFLASATVKGSAILNTSIGLELILVSRQSACRWLVMPPIFSHTSLLLFLNLSIMAMN